MSGKPIRKTSFCRDERGGVLIVGALALPVLIGVAALVAEFGNGLLTRAENQRIADLSSYSGALAYSASSSESVMAAAARNTAGLNGIPPERVSVSLVSSPKTPGAQAVDVTITTTQPLFLARVLSDRGGLSISSSALAEVGTTETSEKGCMLAIAPSGNGLTLSGGTSVNAPDCTVSSNAAVSVPCGTKITTTTLNYNSPGLPSQPCNGIVTAQNTPAPLVKKETPDPFAGNASIATAVARLTTVASLSAPSVPNGNNIAFEWNPPSTQAQAAAMGCTASVSGSTWTLTCPGPTVNIGTMTVGGGLALNFNLAGSPNITYNFRETIQPPGGGTLRFGPGNYNIPKGIAVGGGAAVEFGAGTFRIGPASNGDAINVGGGARLLIADPSGAGGAFEVVGNVTTGGGSCIKLPVAAQHDIKGNFRGSGAVILGAGTYTIDGFFTLTDGGSANCDGASVSLRANNVALVISGKTTASGGCSGQAFCIGGGYSNARLVSPSTGPMANLAVIGPQPAAVTAGARISQGGSNMQVSGAFYFPRGVIELSGGASLGGVPGGCLQLVGFRIQLSGGTTAASECIAATGGGPTTPNVSLVQ